MALESFFTRWRNAVRPPARGNPNAALLAQKRKQRNLIYGTLGVIVLLGGGWSVYSYLADAPGRARAEAELGVREMSPDSYDEAIRRFDRAIEIWPEYTEAYLDRAIAEHDMSRSGPALADLDKALDLDPNSTQAYNERGQIYLENGDAHKAILEFNKSIQVASTLEGHYQRGEAYEKLGEHRKAIADFDAAIAEFNEAPYAYRARAVSKRNSGDRAGAQADESEAQRIETGKLEERDALLAP